MSVLKIRDSKTNAFVDVPVIKGQDGKSLEYKWEGTKLGIRQEGEEEYSYLDFSSDVSISENQLPSGIISYDKLSSDVNEDIDSIKSNVDTLNNSIKLNNKIELNYDETNACLNFNFK